MKQKPTDYRNRIKALEYVNSADLAAHPGNWRDHPAAQAEALKGVLSEVGIAGALLAYRSERQGGALILVEKVLGATADLDAEMVNIYYSLKADNGYTQEQIERKRLSLEGVLVPVTARWNEELLQMSGFREVDCFWRWMNFAGWIAVK